MGEEISFEEEILRLLDDEPFAPFTIVLTSGDRYEVTDPHQVALGGSVVVYVPPRGGISFIRKNQIVAVQSHQPAA